MYLNNLALALRARFDQLGRMGDLEEAIPLLLPSVLLVTQFAPQPSTTSPLL